MRARVPSCVLFKVLCSKYLVKGPLLCALQVTAVKLASLKSIKKGKTVILLDQQGKQATVRCQPRSL